jgi:hypothetical protein
MNGAEGLDYFETHLPAIDPRGEFTWVFTTSRRLPRAARATARVGSVHGVPVGAPRTASALPTLQITSSASGRRAIHLTIHNPTSVPQYQLQIYGLARRGGLLVAAGHASIDHLGTHASTRVSLTLLGHPTTGAVSFEAPPTIFG